jgi:hypothetical protein
MGTSRGYQDPWNKDSNKSRFNQHGTERRQVTTDASNIQPAKTSQPGRQGKLQPWKAKHKKGKNNVQKSAGYMNERLRSLK